MSIESEVNTVKKVRAIAIMMDGKERIVIDENYPSFHHVCDHMKELQRAGYKFIHLIACTIEET